MAKQQHAHPNIWRGSNTGTWGSKFVSVIVFGMCSIPMRINYALDNEEGRPHLRGFQLSNQAEQLITENVLKVSKKKPNKFLISKSGDKFVLTTCES